MNLKAAIIGLPNVGKSTLFNAITQLSIEAANYPFATIEPNIGIVELKDERLLNISKISKSKKIIPATFEFVDIAGLVKGASKGEGLGNKFLNNIRQTNAIVHLVRCFVNDDITHVNNKVDPINDLEVINMELLLSDMEMLDNIIKRLKAKLRAGTNKHLDEEYQVATKIYAAFEKEQPARSIKLNDAEYKLIKNYNLLTIKPIIYVANIAEKDVTNPNNNEMFLCLKNYLDKSNDLLIAISAQIEEEISRLENIEEKQFFLDELGLKETGLNIIVRASFKLLNVSTYFTSGEMESRAWVFNNGSSAPQCAGIIHNDFEKGFIRAEVISYDDFIANGGESGAKQKGKMRLEGKNYIVNDGDICHFRFNV